MSDKYEFALVTMPGFAMHVPEEIFNEAIISLGILEKGIPCGVICANFTDYHYNISWLYIDEKKRKKGYASALLTELLTVIREAGEVYPLQMTLTSNNTDMVGFFQSYEHIDLFPVGEIYNVSPADRKNSQTYMQMAGIAGRSCYSFYRFDSFVKGAFIKKLRKKHPFFAELVKNDLDTYSPELTLAYGKNNIRSAVFCKVSEDKTIDIRFMYSDDAISFGMVLVSLIRKIERDYSDYSLRIISVNDSSGMILRKLFPDTEIEFLLEARWDLRLPGEYPSFNK